MNLKNVNIQLSTVDVQQIIRISLDEDTQEALLFVKEKLFKQIKTALQPHWVPVFEASYGPSQTDRFGRWTANWVYTWTKTRLGSI